MLRFFFNCTHFSALRFFANGISCMNSPTCCSTIFFVISTASPFVLNQKEKNDYFMSTALRKPPFFLYYVYNEWVISTDDFSVKEAIFNLKLAACMQKTSSNLYPGLTKNRSNALICDFYWRLSHYSYSLCIFSCTRVFFAWRYQSATKVNVCMSTCMCICTMLYLIVFHLSELFTYPNKMFVAFDQWGSDNWGFTV